MFVCCLCFFLYLLLFLLLFINIISYVLVFFINDNNHLNNKRDNIIMENTLDGLCRQITNSNQVRRLNRLFNEEFYLLSFSKDDTSSNKYGKFNIAGSTKNVYTINWYKDNSFFCDCPDQKSYCQKLNCVCKHVCFIVCRIGKMYDHNFFKNKKLSNTQADLLLQRLEHFDIDPNAIDTDLACKFAKLLNDSTETKKSFNNGRTIIDDDECPICYDNLKGGKELLACPTCKQWVHKKCINKWLETKDTCVYCRSDVWKSLHDKDDNYLNLNG